MTKYDHNQICTTNNEIEVGETYCYKEDSFIAQVKVLDDNTKPNGIGFELEVIKSYLNLMKAGDIFSVWAADGKYGYSGMWRLYDKGTYIAGGEEY
jgi:hypothetical protein